MIFSTRFGYYLIFSLACPYCGTNQEKNGLIVSYKSFFITRNSLGWWDYLLKGDKILTDHNLLEITSGKNWISQEIHGNYHGFPGFQISCHVKTFPLRFQCENWNHSVYEGKRNCLQCKGICRFRCANRNASRRTSEWNDGVKKTLFSWD